MADTRDIIAESLAASTEVPASEPVLGDETPEVAAADSTPDGDAPAAPEPAAEATTEDAPAAPQKRRGPLPYDRHVAVLTNTRNKYEAQIKERDTRLAALAKYESEDHQAQLKFLNLLETDTPRAVAILKQVDPERFGKLSWAEQQQVAAAVADAAQPAAVIGEKPQPDQISADGSLGYSAEAAEKLLEWRIAQENVETQKQIKALRDELTKELQPVRSEREAKEAFSKALTRQGARLETARKTWPEFTAPGNEDAMKAWLASNPTGDLHDAYVAVVVKGVVTARDSADERARKKVIEDMNARAKKSNTLAPGLLPSARGEDEGPRDTAAIVRESVRRLSAA